MPPASGKKRQKIGRCGELLVQSRLLRYGHRIKSAMTLDYGIDLIALRMKRNDKITSRCRIQVKTTACGSESRRIGKQEATLAVSRENPPADLIDFVAVD